MAKNVALSQPEKVKQFIASKSCSDGYKDNLIDAYSHYCKYYCIQWIKPKYMRVERITRVPREEDINKIISHAKLKYAVAYSVIRDVGLRPVELGLLKVKDVDLETGEVYPITAKHGSGRVLKIKQSTLAMLKKYISENNLSSMIYYKTKDIVYTMRFLGHKNIKNTLRYVHLINFDKDEWVCKVAKTVEEATQLVESGFEYVTEMDGIKLFRKRK